jgi:hypothetical protein
MLFYNLFNNDIMISLISIYVGGALTLGIAIFHIFFNKLFRWKAEFRSNSELNKKVIYTIHIALLFLFLLLGTFTIIYAHELSESTGISFGINLMFGVFWLWRTIWQIIYFKGKLEHYIITLIFFLTSISYFIPLAIN